MSLIDDLLAGLPDKDARIRTVLIGAHWTVVCSEASPPAGLRCGLASTLTGAMPHGQERVRDAGRLHLKSARALAEYARSANVLEAGIGIAAVNSLLEVDEGQGATFQQVQGVRLLTLERKNAPPLRSDPGRG